MHHNEVSRQSLWLFSYPRPLLWTQYLFFFFSLHNMFRPSVPDHLLALTTFQSRCLKTVSCLPPQGGHNILYILPIYCQYNAHIQKMISSSCRMSWAFWLEGVCIPIISTFGLLGKVFLQLFFLFKLPFNLQATSRQLSFSFKLSLNLQATSVLSGFWAAGGPTWTSAQRSPPFLFVWWAIMLVCLSEPPCGLWSVLFIDDPFTKSRFVWSTTIFIIPGKSVDECPHLKLFSRVFFFKLSVWMHSLQFLVTYPIIYQVTNSSNSLIIMIKAWLGFGFLCWAEIRRISMKSIN